MTIYDCWLNPLNPSAPAITVLGYREDLEEFPHELYSFISSSIRDMDIKHVRLLYRFMFGMQQEFESIYGKILNLPLLYSPDYCPEEYLDYLAMQVGITSPDMDYLWGELTTIEKRRLIRIFVSALQYRGTQQGIESLIRSMTGRYSEIREYFDYRWIVSGDSEYEMETALGYEDDLSVAGDPWLLSEASMPVGYKPDSIFVTGVAGEEVYSFVIDPLMDAIVDEPIPPNPSLVRMTYRPTNISYLGVPQLNMGSWIVSTLKGNTFGQSIVFSTNLNDFRVSFEADQYVFDLRLVDDGSVNRNLVKALARFSRPFSERIYIRYFSMIERFEDEDLDNWTDEGGGVTLDTDNSVVTLSDATEESIMRSNITGDDGWSQYSFAVRANMSVAEKILYMRFAWQDVDNYMEIRWTPATEPNIPAGTVSLYSFVAGTPLLIGSANLDQFDLEVNYYFRVVWILSLGNMVCRIYQDENLVIDETFTEPWSPSKGKVEIAVQTAGTAIIKDVEVHPYPMDEDYVGP